MGVFGVKTVSPVLLPVNMVHSIKKFLKVTTLSPVPLHSFDGCLSNIIGEPTFILICAAEASKNSVALQNPWNIS